MPMTVELSQQAVDVPDTVVTPEQTLEVALVVEKVLVDDAGDTLLRDEVIEYREIVEEARSDES